MHERERVPVLSTPRLVHLRRLGLDPLCDGVVYPVVDGLAGGGGEAAAGVEEPEHEDRGGVYEVHISVWHELMWLGEEEVPDSCR